ncbi:MAG: hypothetical protein EOO28_15645 [Comamonadaceae bacterium]|nr:MAG: hypothetical protein EOO28_15645 [Comamonadaceae bacterium]
MKARLPAVAVLVLTTLASSGALAQAVYRCGSIYSQSPCASGKVIDVADARTAEQKKLSESVAQRDGKTADAMEKARLRQEAQAAPAFIVQSTAKPADKAPRPEKKPAAKKHAAKPLPHDFTATDGKKKEKAPKRKAG